MPKRPDSIVDFSDPTQANMFLSQLTSYLSYITFGSGAPSTAPKTGNGTIYLRLDGGAGTTFYVYEGGSWVAK